MTKAISLILLIILIPLSGIFTLIGNFSILDIYILLFVASFLTLRNISINKNRIIEIFLINLLLLIVLFLNVILFDINFDTVLNALQFLFLFNIVTIFCLIFCEYYSFNDFTKYIKYLSVILSGLFLLGYLTSIPLVVEDGSGRFSPIFSGTSSVYIFTLAIASYDYLVRKSNLLSFVFFLFITLMAVFVTGQRSLMVSCLLIFFSVMLLKKPLITIICTLLTSIFAASYVLIIFNDYSELRFIGSLLSDSSRIEILISFIQDILSNPFYIFSGMGIEKWADPIWSQEPHFQFLHLISDYGIFIAIVFLLIGYRFIFTIFDDNQEVKIFSRLLLISALPLLLFHTYSLERGQILIFFIISAYLVNQRIKDKNIYIER